MKIFASVANIMSGLNVKVAWVEELTCSSKPSPVTSTTFATMASRGALVFDIFLRIRGALVFDIFLRIRGAL